MWIWDAMLHQYIGTSILTISICGVMALVLVEHAVDALRVWCAQKLWSKDCLSM